MQRHQCFLVQQQQPHSATFPLCPSHTNAPLAPQEGPAAFFSITDSCFTQIFILQKYNQPSSAEIISTLNVTGLCRQNQFRNHWIQPGNNLETDKTSGGKNDFWSFKRIKQDRVTWETCSRVSKPRDGSGTWSASRWKAQVTTGEHSPHLPQHPCLRLKGDEQKLG